MIKIQHLLDTTASIVNNYNQLLDATGGRFNIFQIIGVTTAETRLHSAFICELLNANGSHGLKDLPLKSFIQKCINKNDKDKVDEFVFQTSDSRSKVEHYIGITTPTEGGRIDIIVWDNENRAIIIENKIYAGDQDRQMLRYYNHSTKYKDSRLLYLSLDGKIPSEYSLGSEIFDYNTLSYKFEIIDWLTECKQLAVDFPLVREAITHYINLIKQLTNITFMDNMNKEIVALIMQSPDNMENAFELGKTLIDIKIQTQWKFWEQLQKSLQKSLEESIKSKDLKIKGDDESKTVNYEKVKGYYKTRNRDTRFGLWIEVFNREGITIHWGCEIGESVYSGFTIEKDGKGGISSDEDMKSYRQIIMESNASYCDTDANWLGWMYTTPQLNFENFNSKEIFELADSKKLENTTIQIANTAISDITSLLEKLNSSN